MIRISLSILFLLTFLHLSMAQSSETLYNQARDLRSTGKDTKAIKKFEEALDAAKAENNIAVQMSVHLELAELKDNVVNYKEALDHYKEFSVLYKKQTSQKTKMLEDSVSGLQSEVNASYDSLNQKNTEIKQKELAIDSLTTEQLQSQLAIKDLELANNQKALELQSAQNRRNILLFVLGIVLLATIFIMRGFMLKRRGVRVLKQKNYEIIMEQQKSDRLLMNILPEKIAYELKEFNKTTPHHHESATIMFTDFKGFTKFSENHSPEELVKLIDYYFKGFDKIVEKYHIEKIKTIGDAYMCVSGIPEQQNNHAANMIRAAFEFRDFVNETAREKQKQNLPFLEMRVGIHSGPLVAGVVGHHKFSYDVWGDAVNIAARMEHASEPGKINVSETVYQHVQHDFLFEYRGELEAKNKGKMKMYFVSLPK